MSGEAAKGIAAWVLPDPWKSSSAKALTAAAQDLLDSGWTTERAADLLAAVAGAIRSEYGE